MSGKTIFSNYWITPFEICTILQIIIRKPNSIIVLLFIQNHSKAPINAQKEFNSFSTERNTTTFAFKFDLNFETCLPSLNSLSFIFSTCLKWLLKLNLTTKSDVFEYRFPSFLITSTKNFRKSASSPPLWKDQGFFLLKMHLENRSTRFHFFSRVLSLSSNPLNIFLFVLLKFCGHFRAFKLLGSKAVVAWRQRSLGTRLRSVTHSWERGCDRLIFDVGQLMTTIIVL